ncbi:M50 family metallopeptidase [Sphingomonas sp.]|uniref:M50 family metallopeptidase n=1 Tax=Sphingomonas sp. TaxID=28214 RepID=UPI003CC5362D
MIHSPGLALTIVAFLCVIGPLVFVHEMGHYWAARLFGVKIDAFSIGMGREVGGWTDRRGTRWKLGWAPIGGYVRFAGDMNAVSQPTVEWLALPAGERARTFQAKPVWQRAIIVAAGPFVNFLLAILILAGFAIGYGDSRTPAVVGGVEAHSGAAAARLQAGDRITALGGRETEVFGDLAQYLQIRPHEQVRVDFVRGGRAQSVQATVGADTLVDRFGNRTEIGLLGIAPPPAVVVPVGLAQAPVVAVRRTGEVLRLMIDTIGQIVTGQRSLKDMGGPLRIAKASGEQMSQGPQAFVALIAPVSINLGFINLLPVPMLDGGHLFFYAIEAIRRRPVGPEVMEWAYRGGLAALLALMLLVTVNDLGSFGLWHRLAGLVG